jgi:hypothetical protein
MWWLTRCYRELYGKTTGKHQQSETSAAESFEQHKANIHAQNAMMRQRILLTSQENLPGRQSHHCSCTTLLST